MRSPLEALDGRWDHAVFTTFTISVPFFESYVLPILAQAGVRNVVVIADRDQLGWALRDARIHRAGTAYHAVGISIGKGVFHPKIAFLSSSAASRLVVSSANLTVSGQLRNLEVATVLETTLDSHVNAVIDAAGFLNRLTDYMPIHAAEAISAATASTLDIPRQPEAEDHPRFVHNLDTALIDELPQGSLTAVAPFADGNGATARLLAQQRPVNVLVDGERFTANEAFFDGSFSVTPITVERRLHGKAYWDTDTAAAGSPNLSTPALRQTARDGNTEAMIVLPISTPLTPPSTEFVGDIQITAIQRGRAARVESEAPEPTARAFNAWEDEDGIAAELPDATVVERPDRYGWTRFGYVTHERVVADDPLGSTPRLLRTIIDGREWIAVVHRVIDLRIRRHARSTSGAASTVTGHAPLDAESQRLLKGVLDEFLALTALFTDPDNAQPLTRPAATPANEPRLSDWRPAHPGDDPNVPQLYRTSWASHPDELLALVRRALRLDDTYGDLDTRADLDETGLDDLAGDQREVDAPDPDAKPPVTSTTVLNRYRGSFMKLLNRGVAGIAQAQAEDWRDLVFQVLMEQTEQLTMTVTIKGPDGTETTDHLIPTVDLDRLRLDALDAYLTFTTQPDPTCIYTARAHLASCLSNKSHWSPLEWERLENIALEHSADLVAALDKSQHPVLRMDPAIIDAHLEPYVQRGTWDNVADAVAAHLENVVVHTLTVPFVTGAAAFDPHRHSPAWEALGTVAFLGFSDDEPFAVSVVNLDESSPWGVQTFVAEPATDRLYEVLDNRNTGLRMMRYYTPVTRGILERAGSLGPLSLADAHRQTITSLPANIGAIVDGVTGLATSTAHHHP